jgi:hypothetical protein
VSGDPTPSAVQHLRRWRESPPPAYGLAVSGQAYVWVDGQPRPVNTLLAALPPEGWRRLRAGDGAKGPRWYDGCGLPWAAPIDPAWRRWRLIRRSLSDPTERRADVICAPQATTLEAVVRVAGTRGTMAQLVEAAKGEVGLEHDEFRSWMGWSRHLTRAMWALALLTVLRAGALAVEA